MIESLSIFRRTYFNDLFLQQRQLDRGQHFTVLTVICNSLLVHWNSIASSTGKDSFFNTNRQKIAKWTQLTSMGYMLIPQGPFQARLNKGIGVFAHLSRCLQVVTAIALCSLRSYRRAAGIFAGLFLAQLQRDQKLPVQVHQSVRFFGFFLRLHEFFTTPVENLFTLLDKLEDCIDIFDGCNRFLQSLGKGVDVANLSLPKTFTFDPNVAQEYAQKAVRGESLPPLEFEIRSVHLIPPFLELELKDGLNKPKKGEIVQRFLSKVEEYGFQEFLGEGFEKLKKAYLEGKFADLVPLRLDLFDDSMGLYLRYMATLNKEEMEPLIKSFDDIGNYCSDGWIGEISSLLPAFKEEGIVAKFHAHLSQVRGEWLNEKLRAMEAKGGKFSASFFEKLFGGINNVHFQQWVHLSARPFLRTKTGEFAAVTSANTGFLSDALSGKIHALGWKRLFSKDFQTLSPSYWVDKLKEAMRPQLILDGKGVMKIYQTITSKDLKDWIAKNHERLPLVDENTFAYNPLFFEEREDIEGYSLLQLTDQGLRLFLLDIGVLKPKS